MLRLFEFERHLVESDASTGRTVNGDLVNALLRRQNVVANAGDHLVGRIGSLYADAADEAAQRLLAASQRGLGPQSFSQALRGRVLGDLEYVVQQLQSGVGGAFAETLRAISAAEQATGVDVLRHAIPADALAHLSVVRPNALVLDASNVEVLGLSLDRWGRRAERDTLDRLAQQIALGSLQGDDMQAMIKRTAGVFGVSQRAAEMTARTAVQTVSNDANARLYEANQDVLGGVQYLAAFERRTCPVCAAYDGRVYRFADGSYDKRPQIPVHPNCRCTYVPITKSWKALGLPFKEISPGTRASMDGQVSGRLTFNSWLKTQPESVQNDILGAGRAALWRSGEVDLGDFVNERTSRPVPMSELRARLGAATTATAPTVAPPPPKAKTIAEATAWAQRWAADHVDYGSLGLDSVNQINRALYDVIVSQDKEKLANVIYDRDVPPGMQAYARLSRGSRDDTIAFGPAMRRAEPYRAEQQRVNDLFRNFERDKRAAITRWESEVTSARRALEALGPGAGEAEVRAAREWVVTAENALEEAQARRNPRPNVWSAGETVYDTAVHELGHIIHYRASGFENGPGEWFGSHVLGGVGGSENRTISAAGREAAYRISEYAGTNIAEYFAEGFNAWRQNPSSVSPELRALFEEATRRAR